MEINQYQQTRENHRGHQIDRSAPSRRHQILVTLLRTEYITGISLRKDSMIDVSNAIK